MDERHFVLDTWRAEAAELFTAGRSAIERADRVLPAIGTVIVAGSIASIANDFPQGFLAVPSLLAVSLAYVANSLSDAVAMGLARKRLEEALAAELGREVLLYETHVAPLRRPADTLSVYGYVLLALMFLVGSAVAGFVIALDMSAFATVCYSVVTGASCLVLALAIRDERRLWRRAATQYAKLDLRKVPATRVEKPV